MRSDQLSGALARVLGQVWSEAEVTVQGLTRLSGGASRETWAFTAVRTYGPERELILRRDPPGAPRGGMALEARVMAAAARAGVPVPTLITASDDPAIVGSSFLIMERIEGETIPRKILRDDDYAGARQVLTLQCAQAAAAIHSIDPEDVGDLDRSDQVAYYRQVLDGLGQPSPAFELAFRWLEEHRPASGPATVVHGDFRIGNFMVGPEGLRAVLDWELVHAGDPMEDLAWLCVKSWRFGRPDPVGGFGQRQELISEYEKASGRILDRAALAWWEVLGNLKWGIMCMMQAHAHMVRSVELAAIGRRVCEVEWDLMGLLAPDVAGPPACCGEGSLAKPAVGLHAGPDAAGLIEAVREFLEGDVMAATEGRVAFHARVAARVLAMVEREIRLGPAQEILHSEALAGLGVADEVDLAAAIRSGAMAGRLGEVSRVVRQSVQAKLKVANPAYLDQPVG
ncbi:MAG: phosphotransferase family protein [Acidimicrobiales bacterium]